MLGGRALLTYNISRARGKSREVAIILDLCHKSVRLYAIMSSVVASLGARSDDSFLDTSNEVASCFLSLYLEPERTSLVDRSPSEGKVVSKAGASGAGDQQPSVPLEVSSSLLLCETGCV